MDEENKKVDLEKKDTEEDVNFFRDDTDDGQKVELTKGISAEQGEEDVNFFREDTDDGRSGQSTAQQQQPNFHIDSSNQYQQNANYNPNMNQNINPNMNPNQPNNVNGLAIASLVCGIFSILICCCKFFSILLGIAAIVLGIVSKKPNEKMSGLALAGIITGGVGAFMGLVSLIFSGFSKNFSISKVIEELEKELDLSIHRFF